MKSRLGRGLNNLISKGTQKTVSKTAPAKTIVEIEKTEVIDTKDPGILEISLKEITANPFQPRKEFKEESLKELADSIRSEGLIQPIVVRKNGSKYELISGERRLRACQSLKLKSILVRVLNASDQSSAIMSLIENLQREDLNPIDEALGYLSLIKDFKLTQEAVAERVGKKRTTVTNLMRLLQLDEEIQGYLKKELIATGHAKILLGIEDKLQRNLLARRIIESGMTVRQAETAAKQLKEESKQAPQEKQKNTVIQGLENHLIAHLQTRVEIKQSKKRGKIMIDYADQDELNRILEHLGCNFS